VTVGEIYGALWRRKFLILLLTICLVGVDALFTTQKTKMYTATTLVRVEQRGTTAADQFGSLQTGALLAATYARIAETSSVADAVHRQLGSGVPRSDINIKGEQISNIELLSLSVTNASPRLAARIANAVPAALATVVKQGGPSPDILTTVEKASPPSSPSSPNVKLALALGLIIGLIVNSGIVLLAAAFADRVGGPEDVERIAGHPVIAMIPNLPLAAVTDFAAPYSSNRQPSSSPPVRRERTGSTGRADA
jgi:succinoglycan biosynthesis transport protein ExoP